MKRSVLSLVFAAAVMASAVTVFAHMKTTKMEPAADAMLASSPAKVQIWFTETPDLKVSKLELTGPAGVVKTGALKVEEKSIVASIEAKLGDGTYMAHWQSAGDDGHVQKGEYSFSVKTTH